MFRHLITAALALTVLIGMTPAGWAQNPAQALRPDDHVLGSSDAEMVMIEYASFSCPHCATFQRQAWPVLKAEFIDTGRVQFALRPMLTNPALIAGAGVIMTECAADDRYYDAADLLFHEQSAIFDALRAQTSVLPIYNRVGAAVGVTPEQYQACFQDPAMSDFVNQQAQQAGQDGIRGTPSFIVRGDILTISPLADGNYYTWGGEPLMLDGDRVPGSLDGDTFRRIVEHFLAMDAD